jgi:hypothetical protein
MTVSMHKTLAALRLPTQVPALLAAGEAIVLAMTGNPSFPDPTPSMASVAAALADLRDAEVATLTRTRGTVAARDAKRAVLVGLLVRLKAYVQGVADADPEQAESLIHGAGMNVRKSGAFAKPELAVRPGALTGTVRMAVRSAGDRACYEWAWSRDGGATWQLAPATLQARTVLTGLPVGSTCALRFRPVTPAGEGNWSQPVLLLVP